MYIKAPPSYIRVIIFSDYNYTVARLVGFGRQKSVQTRQQKYLFFIFHENNIANKLVKFMFVQSSLSNRLFI